MNQANDTSDSDDLFEPPVINLQGLSEMIAQALASTAGEFNAGSIPLRTGFYWTMGSQERYDFDKPPPSAAFTIGSVKDELEFADSTLSEDAYIPNVLTWLGQALVVLGDTLSER